MCVYVCVGGGGGERETAMHLPVILIKTGV